jgi:cysteine desulfurase
VDSFEQGGPPGVAALLQHKGMPLQPLWYGGGQQKGFRPGTLPVALAVGMAAALRIKNP